MTFLSGVVVSESFERSNLRGGESHPYSSTLRSRHVGFMLLMSYDLAPMGACLQLLLTANRSLDGFHHLIVYKVGDVVL